MSGSRLNRSIRQRRLRGKRRRWKYEFNGNYGVEIVKLGRLQKIAKIQVYASREIFAKDGVQVATYRNYRTL